MSTVTLHGNPVNVAGQRPTIGSQAPAFTLVAADLSEKSLADFAGMRKASQFQYNISKGKGSRPRR